MLNVPLMNAESKQDLERVEKAAAALGEHFDTVQIFCTRQESGAGGTVNVAFGQGNWFARFGHVQAWLETEQEGNRSRITRHVEL